MPVDRVTVADRRPRLSRKLSFSLLVLSLPYLSLRTHDPELDQPTDVTFSSTSPFSCATTVTLSAASEARVPHANSASAPPSSLLELVDQTRDLYDPGR